MPATKEARETRAWWVITDGRVVRADGLSCGPDNPTYWWFPTLGFSAGEGFHVFAERGNAVQKAIAELHAQRNAIDAKLTALAGGGDPS